MLHTVLQHPLPVDLSSPTRVWYLLSARSHEALTPLVYKIMNQFRPTCETAAAAAGGCLFPRCISALPSLRDCGGPATAPITPPQPLPGRCITYWAPLDSVPSVENFSPMEWPS